MTTTKTTRAALGAVTLDQIIEQRDYHLREAKRYDDAVAVLQHLAKRSQRAEKLTSEVRTRVAEHAHETPAPSKSAKSAKTTKYQQRHKVYQQQHKERKAANDRPLDRIRAVLAASRDAVLTRMEIVEHARLNELLAPVAAQRAAGVVLAHLVAKREVKKSGDGFVAHKLAIANDNGAHA